MSKYILFFLFPFFATAQNKLPLKFKLAHGLEEVSGLYYEKGNGYWWINDSGGKPILYKTNDKGQLKDSIVLAAKNNDWEELTADDKGNIYIGDFGNNRNARQNLQVLIYNKKNKTLKNIPFTYPDQKEFPPAHQFRNFDMEAFFWFENKLHLFSKNKANRGNYVSKHYTLSDQVGEQVAILRDSLALVDRVVTAAAISPDQKTVALLAYDYRRRKPIPYSKASVFLIRNFDGDNFFKGDVYKIKAPAFILARQYESIDFYDDNTLILASEKTAFIRQKVRRVKLKKKHFKKKRKIYEKIEVGSPKTEVQRS